MVISMQRGSAPSRVAWWLGIAAVATTLTTTSCSSDSYDKTPSTTGSASALSTVKNLASSSAKVSASAETSKPAGERQLSLTTAVFKKALVDQFADLGRQTSRFVKRVHEVGGAPWVETTLYPDSDAKSPAQLMCSAIQQYYSENPSETLKDDPSGLSIRASTGERLVLLTSLADPCKVDL